MPAPFEIHGLPVKAPPPGIGQGTAAAVKAPPPPLPHDHQVLPGPGLIVKAPPPAPTPGQLASSQLTSGALEVQIRSPPARRDVEQSVGLQFDTLLGPKAARLGLGAHPPPRGQPFVYPLGPYRSGPMVYVRTLP